MNSGLPTWRMPQPKGFLTYLYRKRQRQAAGVISGLATMMAPSEKEAEANSSGIMAKLWKVPGSCRQCDACE